MDTDANNVQHVPKKSSDELLRKFADEESPAKRERRVSKRRRRSLENKENDPCESPSNGQNSISLVEKRSLLFPGKSRKSLLRQIGIHGRAELRAREIRHKSIFGSIEKVR